MGLGVIQRQRRVQVQGNIVQDLSGKNRFGRLAGIQPPVLVPSPFATGADWCLNFGHTVLGAEASGIECGVAGLDIQQGDGYGFVRARIRRARSGAGVTEVICGKWGTGTPTRNWVIYVAADKLTFSITNGAGTLVTAVGTTSLSVGTDYLVEAEWTGAVIRVYVNSVQEGTTPSLTTIQAPDTITPFWIGRDAETSSGGNPFPFGGYIDEVEVYVGTGAAATIEGLWRLDAVNVPIDIRSPIRTRRVDVADAATEMEALADQNGAGAVLTFTFASAIQLAWVRSVGGVARAVVGTQSPTASLGAYCADDEPTPLTVEGTTVKVFAPVGATVSVWGMRYT